MRYCKLFFVPSSPAFPLSTLACRCSRSLKYPWTEVTNKDFKDTCAGSTGSTFLFDYFLYISRYLPPGTRGETRVREAHIRAYLNSRSLPFMKFKNHRSPRGIASVPSRLLLWGLVNRSAPLLYQTSPRTLDRLSWNLIPHPTRSLTRFDVYYHVKAIRTTDFSLHISVDRRNHPSNSYRPSRQDSWWIGIIYIDILLLRGAFFSFK